VFSASGLGHEAGGLRPPLASPAPMSLACPHCEEEGLALVLGIGLRLWQLALSFPSCWIDRQLSFFIPSLVLSTFGMVGVLVVVLASSGRLAHTDCSQWVVVMK